MSLFVEAGHNLNAAVANPWLFAQLERIIDNCTHNKLSRASRAAGASSQHFLLRCGALTFVLFTLHSLAGSPGAGAEGKRLSSPPSSHNTQRKGFKQRISYDTMLGKAR